MQTIAFFMCQFLSFDLGGAGGVRIADQGPQGRSPRSAGKFISGERYPDRRSPSKLGTQRGALGQGHSSPHVVSETGVVALMRTALTSRRLSAPRASRFLVGQPKLRQPMATTTRRRCASFMNQ
ncbi:hypothetical protein B0T10DRAFT_220764 [Thelonectria olida]|uniref:Secreted protein n=1 Tax=Thelonectria olida TaxID=1576542 RepID=A0A9P9AUC5_9HYPO|nr:hypothetical protein B0T10DRAFT_220764 [Thelonectria olida]